MNISPIEILYGKDEKSKCFRCGDPAVKQITIGMDGKRVPVVVHACEKAPNCVWNREAFKPADASSTTRHHRPPPK